MASLASLAFIEDIRKLDRQRLQNEGEDRVLYVDTTQWVMVDTNAITQGIYT